MKSHNPADYPYVIDHIDLGGTYCGSSYFHTFEEAQDWIEIAYPFGLACSTPLIEENYLYEGPRVAS